MSQLVSIIIPCYNAAPWLAETLESALAQTWPQIEIIVVDDGSTDDSRTIARRFENDRLRAIHQTNAGAAAARNAGLRAARGEFIQFLDADDLLAPGKIAAQIALLETRTPGTVASCAWGRFTDNPAAARFMDTAVFRDFDPLEFLIHSGETGVMMHPSAWLVPRTVVAAAGPWNETLSLNDDGEYFCRVILASKGIAHCIETAARSHYRSSLPGSLSQQRGASARRSQFTSIELITHRLLAREESARTRRACAGHWRRFVHDFYPAPADLIAKAEAEIRHLGEFLGTPTMGPKTAALARFLGWRQVWRLKYWLGR